MADEVKLVLRMPAALHERVKRIAEAERRSLNGEILHILERYAAQYDRRPSPELAALLAALVEAELSDPSTVSMSMRDGKMEMDRPPGAPTEKAAGEAGDDSSQERKAAQKSTV